MSQPLRPTQPLQELAVPTQPPRVPGRDERLMHRFALTPVGLVTLIDALLLAATVNRYGYDRDELYFRMLASHPAWGYVDQPPLTPLIVRGGMALFGDNLWALRVPAMLFALTAVLLTALLARELGGGRAAQTLAAAGTSCAFVFIVGHVLLTATPDLVVWLLVILFAARALGRSDPRWWMAAGVSVGLGLFNKQLVVLLVIGLVVGLLIAGPRVQLRKGWFWAGAGVALAVGAPNLVYQMANSWPELAMARALAEHKGGDDRTFFIPFQLVLLGITIAPIWIAGLIGVLRDNRFRSVRALGWAYLAVSLIVLVTGGQPYYTFGLLAFLFAAGCVMAAEWARDSGTRWISLIAAVATSVVTGVAASLPVIPVGSIPPWVATANQTTRDSVGWPVYVRQVADVYASLPRGDQAHAVILTNNYGEAGAISRFGNRYRLPAVYSGQNELFHLGPPPSSATVVIAVGLDNYATEFDTCAIVATLASGIAIDNEEQGRTIRICRGPHDSWAHLWPRFQHYD